MSDYTKEDFEIFRVEVSWGRREWHDDGSWTDIFPVKRASEIQGLEPTRQQATDAFRNALAISRLQRDRLLESGIKFQVKSDV